MGFTSGCTYLKAGNHLRNQPAKHTYLSVQTLSLQSAEPSFTLVSIGYIEGPTEISKYSAVYQQRVHTWGWAFRCPVFISFHQEKTIQFILNHQEKNTDLQSVTLCTFSAKNLLLEGRKYVIGFKWFNLFQRSFYLL